MVPTTVQIDGIDQLRARIREVRGLEPMRREVLLPAAKLGQQVAREGAGAAEFAKNVRYRTSLYSSRVYVTDYRARFVEYGRREGKKLPPVDNAAFQDWARRKGIDKSNLFVVARAIAKRGIKGRFFMKKGRDAVANALPALMDNCARALERLWGES